MSRQVKHEIKSSFDCIMTACKFSQLFLNCKLTNSVKTIYYYQFSPSTYKPCHKLLNVLKCTQILGDLFASV